MKTLFILRHAKSSWDNSALTDFERPLNERGRRDAPRMGRLMRERALRPDVILCSPAERTRQTAALARLALDIDAWDKVGAESGRLEWVVRPKELGDG